MEKLIAQGAEAKIFLDKSNKKEDFIIKNRIKKSYRTPELDKKIRTRRTRAEIKIMIKASKIILCPKPNLNKSKNSTKISMPYIKGKKLSQNLNTFPEKTQKSILQQIGKSVAKLHNSGIIHGDLTTSNMILSEKENKVYFIDFGLSFQNSKYEDKAVDIHLLKQALEAKHFQNWKILYKNFLNGYQSIKKAESEKVLNQLKKVEKRGRYKS